MATSSAVVLWQQLEFPGFVVHGHSLHTRRTDKREHCRDVLFIWSKEAVLFEFPVIFSGCSAGMEFGRREIWREADAMRRFHNSK